MHAVAYKQRYLCRRERILLLKHGIFIYKWRSKIVTFNC